jgi:hypothetical protein
MTDLKLNTRIRELSEELQRGVGQTVERWAGERRGQLRGAMGTPGESSILAAFVAGVAVGALVGTIAALMLAPKRGAELRDEIAERARRTDGQKKETVSPLERLSGATE